MAGSSSWIAVALMILRSVPLCISAISNIRRNFIFCAARAPPPRLAALAWRARVGRRLIPPVDSVGRGPNEMECFNQTRQTYFGDCAKFCGPIGTLPTRTDGGVSPWAPPLSATRSHPADHIAPCCPYVELDLGSERGFLLHG